MKNWTSLAAVASALSLTMISGASASVVTATFNNVGPSEVVTVTLDAGANTRQVHSGLMNWTRTGGDYTGVGTTFWTFCTEITETVSGGASITYNVMAPEFAPNTAPMGPARAALLSELFGRYIGVVNFGSATDMSAFQMAVWEIAYDDGVDLSGGDFRVTAGPNPSRNLAQSFLNALDGTGPRVNVDALVNVGRQDQLVPTPGAFALLGLAGLAGSRRRR